MHTVSINGDDAMSTSFGSDTPADLAPYLARELAKDQANVAYFETEAARRRGVSFSGSAPLSPPAVRTPRDHIAAAEASAERDREFKRSPRGRLIAAIIEIEKSYPSTGDRMRSAYSRGLSGGGCNTNEIAFLLCELGGLPLLDGAIRSPVSAATLALGELLAGSGREAA
jgi:hypothetical protein